MAVSPPVQLDRQRIKELTEREERVLNEKTASSGEMYKRAQQFLSGGVASSYQLRDPWPIYLERGSGPLVWDVDGNEYFDFHNGFGSMVQGHANPVIRAAIPQRYALGAHFAAPAAAAPPLRGPDRGRDRRRRGARLALEPRAVALHEPRRGVDDGRDPDRPRV